MARFTFPALLAALGSFSLHASAQQFNTSPPFILQISSDDEDISGQVLNACHSGAAIENLCLAGNDTTPTHWTTFNLNVSTAAYVPPGRYETGALVWVLQGRGDDLSEALTFSGPALDSNVVAPQFFPGRVAATLGFDDDDKLFMYSSSYDETAFVPAQSPIAVTPQPLYRVSLLFSLAWLDQSSP